MISIRDMRRWAGLLSIVILAGCATWHPPSEPMRSPGRVKAEIDDLLPPGIDDHKGWSQDLYSAFATQDLAMTTDNLCAAIAVIGQESTFEADPSVPGLARIAREEIERRASSAHVPTFVVNAALNLESSNGQTYNHRLSNVHTEGELNELFEDFTSQVPLGRQLFGSLNPVHTGGPMQVSVDFAKAHADDYPYADEGSVRSEVFSRRGGVYFGVANLLGYPADYPSLIYRFADYNAGWYASRNAAFQQAVAQLTGISLALDGDLTIHGSRRTSQTERATRRLAERIDQDEDDIHDALRQGQGADFAETDVYRRVFVLADQQAGRTVDRAVLPDIELDSPKITRDLTTAWFAKRVESRWQECMARGRYHEPSR